MANTIFHILSVFFAHFGYWVVFFGVMCENLGVPIPGETVLLFAGFLAYQGGIQIVPAILTAIAGATVGACGGYGIGWRSGPVVVTNFLGRFPHFAKQYDDAQRMFLKHGQWAVFTARFITGVRVFAGILAGALRMPFGIFLFFSFAGAVCWSVAIGYVGLFFGSNWDALVRLVGRMDRIVLLVLLLAALAVLLARSLRRRKSA